MSFDEPDTDQFSGPRYCEECHDDGRPECGTCGGEEPRFLGGELVARTSVHGVVREWLASRPLEPGFDYDWRFCGECGDVQVIDSERCSECARRVA